MATVPEERLATPGGQSAAQNDASATPIDADTARELLRLMVLCRVLEQTCCELNPRWFPAEGEEAAIVGAFHGLRADDFIAAHYRGPFIAYYMRGDELPRLVGLELDRSYGYASGHSLSITVTVAIVF